MTTKTLYCEAGQHEWERPAQKGRAPINCPEHKVQSLKVVTNTKSKPKQTRKTNNMTGLQKAQAARRDQKLQKEKEWAEKVEAVINDPRMTYAIPAWGDCRQTTVSKLRYIQDQLQNNRKNRDPRDLADLEEMREKIMKDPFSRTGHLL